MRVALDTNAYTHLFDGHREVGRLVSSAREVLLSSVALGEILAGYRNGHRLERNLPVIERFLADPQVSLLPVTRDTADRYGRIFAELRRKGRPIPTNDMWIAAHTMETGAELISFDRHFEAIDGLVWTRLER